MEEAKLRGLYAKRDDEFDEWREAVESVGIDTTLAALGYSRDRNALWYNEHTGSAETLESLIVAESFTGRRNETEEERLREFAIVLEHWLPQDGATNPVIARAAAMTEYDALRQIGEVMTSYIERNDTVDDFVYDVHSMGGTLPSPTNRCPQMTA
jgi:hypothetical protein